MTTPLLGPEDLAAALALAERAALAAEPPLLRYFRNDELVVEEKHDGSDVSRADREAEEAVVAVLRADPRFGGLAILGEEYGDRQPIASEEPLRWIVDPLDGTSSYVRRLPFFGTLIALEDTRDGTPLVGVMRLPVFATTYSAARGLGAHCDGAPLRIVEPSDPTRVVVGSPGPRNYKALGLWAEFEGLVDTYERIRGYWDCYHAALIVDRAMAASIEFGWARWDMQALRVLVEEAGGCMVSRRSELRPDSWDSIYGARTVVQRLVRELRFE